MRGVVRRTSLLIGLFLLLAQSALANHDTDCTAAGGTNGPGQLDCSLPDFVVPEGSTSVSSSFTYTPSTDFNPATCAVGTMSVDPDGQWLSIDTTVLDASSPANFQQVDVFVDPTGLAPGTYDGDIDIVLTQGPMAPQCPMTSGRTGTVSVRLIVLPLQKVPAAALPTLLLAALGLGAYGGLRARRRRAMSR